MTNTDRAFIRVFDGQSSAGHSAPHFAFASHDVEIAPQTETVEVSRNARVEPLREEVDTDLAAGQSVKITAETAKSAGTKPLEVADLTHTHGRRTSSTYLPGAFRNPIGIAERDADEILAPIRVPVGQTGQPTPELPAAEASRTRSSAIEFRPALEVDGLRWPQVVRELLSLYPEIWQSLKASLVDWLARGQRIIVVNSTRRSAGSTTIALLCSRLIAEAGYSTVVVDADFLHPNLGRTVGLLADSGWERTLLANEPLAESVVRSLDDNICVVPLTDALREEQLTKRELAGRIETAWRLLANQFEAVVLDAGCLSTASRCSQLRSQMFTIAADASLLVDSNHDDLRNGVSMGEATYSEMSLPLVGVIENSVVGA